MHEHGIVLLPTARSATKATERPLFCRILWSVERMDMHGPPFTTYPTPHHTSQPRKPPSFPPARSHLADSLSGYVSKKLKISGVFQVCGALSRWVRPPLSHRRPRQAQGFSTKSQWLWSMGGLVLVLTWRRGVGRDIAASSNCHHRARR